MLEKLESWYLEHRLGLAKRSVFVLAALLLIFAALVSTRSNSLSVQGEPSSSPVAANLPLSGSESSEFETQFEHLRWFDERLIQTVYWSLGVIATISALLVGFSWFTNVRLADRDRHQLHNEIKSGLEVEIDQRLNDLQAKALETLSSELIKSEEKHQRDFDGLKHDIATTRLLLLENVARGEAGMGNTNALLNTAIMMLSVGIEAGVDASIPRSLDLLQDVLSNDARPSADQAARVNHVLELLPAEFSTDRDIVKQLLTAARTSMNMDAG